MRPNIDHYFLGIAWRVASRSTCLRVPNGVGCILVRDRQILATGYGGSIKGTPHCTDEGVGCLIDATGCERTVHAETNAVIQAHQNLTGATAYCTLSPCWNCFKTFANAGIVRIVYAQEYRIVDRQREFAALCKIKFEHVAVEP